MALQLIKRIAYLMFLKKQKIRTNTIALVSSCNFFTKYLRSHVPMMRPVEV